MKNTAFLIALAALALGFSACEADAGSFVPEGETLFDRSGSYALGMDIGTGVRMEGGAFDVDEFIAGVRRALRNEDESYAMGMSVGTSLRMNRVFPDMDEFAAGMRDALRGEDETRYTMAQAMEIIAAAIAEIAAAEDRRNAAFLEENAARPGVTVTDSGLQFEVITEGDGPRPGPFDVVRVHYEGTLIDGTVFDSSIARGVPAEFPVQRVIAGWIEGLQLMNVGSSFRFFIPAHLGYGERGMGPVPPHSTLIFEVELLGIVAEGDENDEFTGF